MSVQDLVAALADVWDMCEKEYVRRYGKAINVEIIGRWFERADHHIISDKIQADRQTKPKEPPTERQIEYARNLGIKNPEKYSKQELAEKIGEAAKEQNK